jgi:hypothetical protein
MQIEPGAPILRTAMKKWRGIAAGRDGGGGSTHRVAVCGS